MIKEPLKQTSPLLFCGDCMELLPQIEENSIDMILCDLPYHVTKNHWDMAIPLEDYLILDDRIVTFSELKNTLWHLGKRNPSREKKELNSLMERRMSEVLRFWKERKRPGLWTHYKRLIKPHGAITLFGSGMFSAELMTTGKDLWRYNIIWQKNHPTGFLNANRMPLRSHEDILVFYRMLPPYHPQKSTGHPRKVSTAEHKRNSRMTTNYGSYKMMTYDSTERFPTSVWYFPTDKERSTLHPTQKPVALCEELIKTYTNAGDLVLDNCAGSFTTAVASDNLRRNWIAIEKDKDYFHMGISRVNDNRQRLGLPQIKLWS